jgi:hypothetical protein
MSVLEERKNNMKSPRDVLETIKSVANDGGSVGFKFDQFTIPVKLADKKAIEIIELMLNDDEMEDMTIRDFHEILDFAKFWLEFVQLLKYNDERPVPDVLFGDMVAV